MKKIFLTNPYSGEMLKIVQSLVPEGFELILPETGSQEECVRLVKDADYLFAGHSMYVNEDILTAGKKLKMVQRFGVGMDTVDVEALKAHNMPLYVNRGVNAESVAELSFLLILAMVRRLPDLDNGVHRGEWDLEGISRHELKGQTVGLIGLGKIGSLVARMLAPFGTKTLYYKPHRLSEEEENELHVSYRDLDDLLAESDIVSMQCMMNAGNKHMMNRETFAKMKTGAKFVNTARGGLVDEEAFAEAILSGKLSAGALDNYNIEPLPEDSILRSLPNVILTPHAGGVTRESFGRIMSEAFGNIKHFDDGDLESIADRKIV